MFRVVEHLDGYGNLAHDGVHFYIFPPGINPTPVRVVRDLGTYLMTEQDTLVPRPSAPVLPTVEESAATPASIAPSPEVQVEPPTEPSSPVSDGSPLNPLQSVVAPSAAEFLNHLRVHLRPAAENLGPLEPGQVPWWPEDQNDIPIDTMEFLLNNNNLGMFVPNTIQGANFARVPMLLWMEAWHWSRSSAWRNHLLEVVEEVGRMYANSGNHTLGTLRSAQWIMRTLIRPKFGTLRLRVEERLNDWRLELPGRLFAELTVQLPGPADNTEPDPELDNRRPNPEDQQDDL